MHLGLNYKLIPYIGFVLIRDKNELWIDIAIQPVKAIEFIYIPLRIKNTGESLTS